jgi:hypothetical protein
MNPIHHQPHQGPHLPLFTMGLQFFFSFFLFFLQFPLTSLWTFLLTISGPIWIAHYNSL